MLTNRCITKKMLHTQKRSRIWAKLIPRGKYFDSVAMHPWALAVVWVEKLSGSRGKGMGSTGGESLARSEGTAI